MVANLGSAQADKFYKEITGKRLQICNQHKFIGLTLVLKRWLMLIMFKRFWAALNSINSTQYGLLITHSKIAFKALFFLTTRTKQ